MQVEVFFTIPDAFGTHHTPVLLNASASVRGILSIFKFGCLKKETVLMRLCKCARYVINFLSLAVQRGNSSIAPHIKVENVVRQTAHSASLTFSHILISFWTQ